MEISEKLAFLAYDVLFQRRVYGLLVERSMVPNSNRNMVASVFGNAIAPVSVYTMVSLHEGVKAKIAAMKPFDAMTISSVLSDEDLKVGIDAVWDFLDRNVFIPPQPLEPQQ